MIIRSGYAAIIGKPNAGKSTLLNALLNEKISIITDKPQTTRKRVLGILSGDDYQIIFLDTPGILSPEYLLQEKMVDYIKLSVDDADLLICLIDIDSDPDGEIFLNTDIFKWAKRKKTKKIIAINKVDLSSKEKVKLLKEKLEKQNAWDSVIPVSASGGYNIGKLKESIIKMMPEHPKYYPDDQLSDEPERFFVSEIIREKVFEMYHEEIPYSVEVLIEDFKEREGRKDYVLASVIVERESQKPIIIGKKGETIKKLGSDARKAIEEFLGRPVFLELQVKVRNKWRSDPRYLKNFGYIPSND